MSSGKLTSTLVRGSDVLASLLAMFAVVVRPMFSGLAAPLHRNILIYLLVFMAALLVTLSLALRKRLDLPAPALTCCLLGLIAVSAVTTMMADYRFGAIIRMLDIVAWAVLVIVLVQVISTPFRGRIVLAALVATLAVLAANGFHQYFAVLPGIERDLPEHIRRLTASGTLHPSLIRTMEKRATSGDVFGEFVIANSFAGCLIVLLPGAFAAALASLRETKKRVSASALVTALAALAGLVVLFLTRSKGGILAFAGALALGGIAAVLRRKGGGKAAVATAAVLLAALLLTAQALPNGSSDTAPPKRTSGLRASADVRLEYWKGGWEILKRHPWLGVGPGNFSDHYLAHRTPEGSETQYAHNDYLEIAVEMGIVGLAVYLGIWAAWFWSMRAKPPRSSSEDEEDEKGRHGFVVVVGLVGVAAVFFTMSRFIPTGETRMMTLVGMLVWLGVYGVQARHVLHLEGEQDARLLRGALMVGVCAFLLHSAIDFDFNVPGVTYPLAGVLAAGLALRRRGTDAGKPRPFGTGGQLVLTALVAVPITLVLLLLFYPLIDMSVALEGAQLARRTHAERLQEAEDALKRGDHPTCDQKVREAREIVTVQLPEHLREAIAAYGTNPEPYMELARLEAAPIWNDPTGDRSRVDQLLAAAKRLRPHDPEPYMTLVQLIQSQMEAAEAKGQRDRVRPLAEAALRETSEAIERYPTQPRMRWMRGRLFERLSRRGEAIEEYRKALDLAERTSEKELKFSPEEANGIRQVIRRLETP